MTLSPLIREVCAEHFGRVAVRAGRKQLVENRCEKCPLRVPCLAFGGAPARTFDELDQARATFAAAAAAVLGVQTP